MVPKNWALLLKSRFIAAGRIFKWKVTKFWLIKMHSMMLGMNWNHYFFSKEVFLQCKNWTLFAEFALIWRKNLLIARTVCNGNFLSVFIYKYQFTKFLENQVCLRRQTNYLLRFKIVFTFLIFILLNSSSILWRMYQWTGFGWDEYWNHP